MIRLDQRPWREVRAAGERGAVAVLPVGSQEQHSEHLPMGTDTLLVEAVVDAAAGLLGDDGPELVRLPALPFGHSPHHLFAAAVSLSATTLLAVLDDALDSLVRSGFRRVLLVNGHAGNDEVVRLAVKRCAERTDVALGACSYWTLAGPGEPPQSPGHAGWFETSLLLAVHPDLVRAAAPWREPDPPALFHRSPAPGLVVARHGEWERVGGATDDAGDADAETGRSLLAARAGVLAAAIRAFDEATAGSHGPAAPR
ncbi:creatininase family protein [Pseudonocardia adelaidensis]|uniref:creatininase family protein n=1 Tax=Pseudonocardia adelaidensis TaxID=648754 RepID=UPI0031F181D9